MIFEQFFINKIRYIKYGDEDNGLTFSLTENNSSSFYLKFIKEKEIKMLLITRVEENHYILMIKDNFSIKADDNQIMEYAKQQIIYYVMNEKPVKIVTA